MIRPLASLALGAAFAAVAVSAAPRTVTPAATPFRVGRIEVVSLRDAVNVVPNDGSVFGIDQSPAAVANVLRARGAPADPITLGVDQLHDAFARVAERFHGWVERNGMQIIIT